MQAPQAQFLDRVVDRCSGLPILIREAVAVELQGEKLATIPIKDQNIYLDVSIAHLKHQPLSPPAQAFLESLKNWGTKEMRFQGMGALMEKMLSEQR